MTKCNILCIFGIITILMFSSCSKEEPGATVNSGSSIVFVAKFPDDSATRATSLTFKDFNTFYVTCFNTPEAKLAPNGAVFQPYFKEVQYDRDGKTNTFVCDPLYAIAWPQTDENLDFFAYYPADKGTIFNTSTVRNGKVNFNYRMTEIKVPQNIAEQFDLVTAYASSSRRQGPVALDFKHQFTMVELQAIGGNPQYNIEIAGVCIGNPVVEGVFDLSAGAANPEATGSRKAGAWVLPASPVKKKVQYIFRGTDKIVEVKEDATTPLTIMGKGGNAMVVPAHCDKWEALQDPAINAAKYATDKMYFSVLVRVTRRSDGVQMYPYTKPDERAGMRSEWFAVGADGSIKARRAADGTYRTDNNSVYTPSTGETREYGWAAVPVEVDWTPGLRYVYQLNYATGVGLHDPEDPLPGHPILGEVKLSVTLKPWGETQKETVPVPGKDKEDKK